MAAKPGARAAPADTGLTPEEADLFARLKARRLEIALDRHIPVFTILTDAVLRQLAVERPRTVEAFAVLNGVGPAKTRDWAGTFLAIVREEAGEDDGDAVLDEGVDLEGYGDDVGLDGSPNGFGNE